MPKIARDGTWGKGKLEILKLSKCCPDSMASRTGAYHLEPLETCTTISLSETTHVRGS